MLMSANDGRIDHHVLVVTVFCQCLENALENATLTPPPEPLVDVLPITKAPRKIAPGDARSVAIENGLHKKPVVPGGHANMAFTTGEKVFDPFPLIVAKSIASYRHWSAPFQADPP
jgi:hypothetical protein